MLCITSVKTNFEGPNFCIDLIERRLSFLEYLRRQLNSKEKQIIKNFKLVDSHGNVLIQLADMIAGSIHRSHNIVKDDAKLYKSIIKKESRMNGFLDNKK